MRLPPKKAMWSSFLLAKFWVYWLNRRINARSIFRSAQPLAKTCLTEGDIKRPRWNVVHITPFDIDLSITTEYSRELSIEIRIALWWRCQSSGKQGRRSRDWRLHP